MKEVFLNNSLNLLTKKYDYDDDTLDRVKYGLEIMYITITKLFVIYGIAFIFGVFKESLIFSIFSTFIRTFAYGAHAKKNWHCYISSLFAFVLMPYVFSTINITIVQKIIISILCMLSMLLFAPADTHKRPLINKKHRIKLKIASIIICLLYITMIFLLENVVISNLIILSMITQSIVINPTIYKLFDLPYNNYKEYLKNGI